MANVLVVYYSRGGNTRQMAELVAEGATGAGADVDLKAVGKVSPEALLDYDGIVMGSPTYYGQMSAEIKALLDQSVEFHGKLDGKVGGAFSSAANIGGGNETTIMGILEAMLIHGMIIQGTPQGDHYGPVAVDCRELGERVAQLADKLAG